ncbi:hypothetical protein PRV_02290 [Mycoplasma parvum str. Indiana]|uniref:Uncharacterized protein n=1 Tax=Mycoplasma parvum str. Indiana TaxID=1403316 RepID=U5NC88_9MOLU|nr:hypothetical protein PRV_02290 [Mycoplasma parvum str. Indiana]
MPIESIKNLIKKIIYLFGVFIDTNSKFEFFETLWEIGSATSDIK